MKRFIFSVTAIAMLIGLSAASADKLPYPGQGDTLLPKRMALVVGIENYGDQGGDIALSSLPDATEDAKSMAKLLPDIGFDDTKLVIRTEDRPLLDKATIQSEIKDFKDRAKGVKDQSGRAPILLFYFSGHGFSTDSGSYLIPSNFFADDLYTFQANAISLTNEVVLKLQADLEPALQIIITDSCRSAVPVNLRPKLAFPGNASLARSSVRPAPGGPGKNRTLFFYSTLDGDAAYGTADSGGRFTNALMTELRAAVQEAKPSPVISISQIVANASQAMSFNTAAKWQKPSKDEDWGAPFYLLPFAETFNVEKTIYDSMEIINDVPPRALRRYECSLRDNLRKISEFSYFSQKIIQNMQYQGDPDCTHLPPLGGGSAGVAAPPVRDNEARWDVPSLAAPAAIPAVQPAAAAQRRGAVRSPLLGRDTASSHVDARSPALVSTKSLLDSFAQIGNNSQGTAAPTDTKPNFGELRSAVEQQGSIQQVGQLPGADVPLDQAVVAKTDLFLRKAAGPQYGVTASIPAGEILQVLGTSTGRTWLSVRHASLGAGFVSGDLVEPALMTFSKSIAFDSQQYELSDAIKSDLTATFALLGGVAIVDGYVEYPESNNILDLSRATLTGRFVSQLATQADSSKTNRLYISVRQVAGNAEPLKPNTVRLVMLALPLDIKTRAQLAQSYQTGGAIKLEPVNSVLPSREGEPNASLPNLTDSTVGERDCTRDPKSCYPSSATTSLNYSLQKETHDTGKSIDKAAQDAGKAVGKATQSVGKAIDNAALPTGTIVGGPNSQINNVTKLGRLLKF